MMAALLVACGKQYNVYNNGVIQMCISEEQNLSDRIADGGKLVIRDSRGDNCFIEVFERDDYYSPDEFLKEKKAALEHLGVISDFEIQENESNHLFQAIFYFESNGGSKGNFTIRVSEKIVAVVFTGSTLTGSVRDGMINTFESINFL